MSPTRVAGLLTTIGRSYRLVYRSAPALTLLHLSLSVANGVLPLLSLVLFKRVFDLLTLRPSDAWAQLVVAIALWFACQMVGQSLGAVARFVEASLANDVSVRLRIQLLRGARNIDYAVFEGAAFIGRFNRLRQESDTRPIEIIMHAFGVLRHAIFVASTLAAFGTLQWWLAPAAVILNVPSFLLDMWYSRNLRKLLLQQTAAEAHADYLLHLLTSLPSVRELRALALYDGVVERWTIVVRRLRTGRRDIDARKLCRQLVVYTTTACASGAIYLLLAHSALIAAISIGTLAFCFQAFNQVNSTAGNLFFDVIGLDDNATALREIFEYIDRAGETIVPPQLLARADEGPGLRFHNVSFRYPDATVLALDDVSFVVRPGERIAIVGRNGAGKSTVVRLIAGLYRPTSGRVTLDGVDIWSMSLEERARKMSLLFQETVRFHFTAGENIAFGDALTKTISADRLRDAAELSSAAAFIDKLPGGYDCLLGRGVHDGAELSGGEWQRLALARAFLKKARLLVLDEPTSSLDRENESRVAQTLARGVGSAMVVVISHQLRTLDLLERVLVLDGGKLVESGSKEELLTRDGVFCRLSREPAGTAAGKSVVPA